MLLKTSIALSLYLQKCDRSEKQMSLKKVLWLYIAVAGLYFSDTSLPFSPFSITKESYSLKMLNQDVK